MEFEKSIFYDQFKQITLTGNSDANYLWSAAILANGFEVTTFKIVDLDVIRNYVENYADHVTARLMMLYGDYAINVYPYRQDIEIVIYKTPLSGMYPDSDTPRDVIKMTYKALIRNNADLVSQVSGGRASDIDSLNLLPPITIEFDLVRKQVMQLRMMSCGQIFRNTTPAKAVLNLLTLASRQITGNKDELIKGVLMTDANNQNVTDHVIIPQPTALVDLPGFIQKNCNGIYNNGIGFYMQGNYWHVFAPFDTTRFKKVSKTLTIIRVPQNRFEGIDRTWSLVGDNLTILAVSTLSKNDTTANQKLDTGTGAIYTDASKVMEGFAQVKDNKVVVSRSDNNNEMTTEQRKDGYTRALSSANRITSNSCVEQSKLSVKSGSILTINWTHSDPELIEPCMPTKIVMLDGDNTIEIEGVVVMSDTQYSLMGQGAGPNRHSCITTLHIFYKPIDKS